MWLSGQLDGYVVEGQHGCHFKCGLMELLKRRLALEAKYQLREAIFDELLASGEEVRLSTYDPMIDAGEFNPNVYIVKEGLVRGTYLDKNIEKTAGFALPGTLLISFHSYYGNEPSYYRYEACCPTVVVRIPKKKFEELTEKYHEFALWVVSAHQNQLYYNEYKNRLLSGDAKSRLIRLATRLQGIITDAQPEASVSTEIHNKQVEKELHGRWKDIFLLVPSKVIASYLGITEQYLSKIKKEMLQSSKEK